MEELSANNNNLIFSLAIFFEAQQKQLDPFPSPPPTKFLKAN